MEAPFRSPPTVKLDGDTVRRIREEKSLTQLYVAEVAGVSVDTVSRWENNRTQAVRRENAQGLARALEVELEAILPGGGRTAGQTTFRPSAPAACAG